MDLSIIIPVYNVERYVLTCLESVFHQNIDENRFEVIIVNDGSQDQSMKTITDIIAQHTNIIVINQANQGLSVARNNGIMKATGEYLLMLDSDDLLPDNGVKPLLEYAIEVKPEMIVADYLTLSDAEISQLCNHSIHQMKELYIEDIKGEDLLMVGDCRFYWRILFRRDFLRSGLISFYPNILAQDIPFTTECFLKVKTCKRTSWILYLYRHGHASASKLYSLKRANDTSIAIAKVWELRNIENLPLRTKRKLQELTFNLVYSHFCAISFGHIKNKLEVVNAIKFFRQNTPANMLFLHGLRQVVWTLLFRYTPAPMLAWLLMSKQQRFRLSGN